MHKPRCSSGLPVGGVQQFKATIRVTRKPYYYLVNFYLILFLLVCMTFGCWAAPINELTGRLEVSISLLLTGVAYKLVLGDNIPRVSYLTLLDKYVTYCFMYMFAVLVEMILAGLFTDGEGTVMNHYMPGGLMPSADLYHFELVMQSVIMGSWVLYNASCVLQYFVIKRAHTREY